MNNILAGFLCLIMVSGYNITQAQKKRSVYDENNRKVMEYSYSYDMSTECSVPQEVKNKLKGEVAFYNNVFSDACATHDYGWTHTPWQKAGFKGLEGKRIADKRFRYDMQRACDARFKSALDAPRKAACYAAAEIYFAAVYHKVDQGWDEKQREYTADPKKQILFSIKQSSSSAVKASKSSVWGVNKNDDIFFWNGSGGWTKVAGKLKDVSIGSDGTIWGVNKNDDIFKRKNNTWVRVSGKLKQISVGNGYKVWGVNSADQIYRRSGNGWVRVKGALKHVSAASDGTVWGVNSAGAIYRWNGSGWNKIPGALKMISVGSRSQVWGVNSAGSVYKWSGSRWIKKPGVLKNVSVAADGTVWGVNRNDNIYKWNGSTWVKTSGFLKDLEVKMK